MLKSLDVITLISHFRFTFMEISLQRVFVCHLIFHVDLSSSPLTARFEDVNASSLDCYTNKLVKWSRSNLLLMLREPLKARAISGSSSIIKSFFLATSSLRFLMADETQVLNGSPMIEKTTFMIHCRGRRRMSRSSGRWRQTYSFSMPILRIFSTFRPSYWGTWRFLASSDLMTTERLIEQMSTYSFLHL